MGAKDLSLKARLLQRNAREKITEELKQQLNGAAERNYVLFSTEELEACAGKGHRLDSDEYRKKVGIVSNVKRGYNPHEGNKGSNRTSFFTFGGTTCCEQDHRGRTMRK